MAIIIDIAQTRYESPKFPGKMSGPMTLSDVSRNRLKSRLITTSSNIMKNAVNTKIKFRLPALESCIIALKKYAIEGATRTAIVMMGIEMGSLVVFKIMKTRELETRILIFALRNEIPRL